jgi:AbiV family abortive infection protein
MRAKRGFDRMRPFLQAITALANEDEPLGSVASEQGAVTALRNLVNHCEELWSDAADLFMRGRYAPAQFLAIACVEETAKVLVARVQAANWKTRARAPKRPRDLENHRRKHWLAACGAAVINSRMDRIFGFDRVNWFIGLAEDEAVETIRQRSLYAEIVGNEQHLPYGHVVADDAKYLVAIAGELLAEATGLPEDFRRIIDAVSRFEDDCGIEASVPQLDDTGAVPPTPTPPTLEEPR